MKGSLAEKNHPSRYIPGVLWHMLLGSLWRWDFLRGVQQPIVSRLEVRKESSRKLDKNDIIYLYRIVNQSRIIR